jgi:hypothetical protein
LDGETDWKLKLAIPASQKLAKDEDLINMEASIYAGKLGKVQGAPINFLAFYVV